MREEALSIATLGGVGLGHVAEQQKVVPEVHASRPALGWNPESFVRQQIHCLVRQVFFPKVERRMRQVIFSAVQADAKVADLCFHVGAALARQTAGSVAVGVSGRVFEDSEQASPAKVGNGISPLRRIAMCLRGNLWVVPSADSNGHSAAQRIEDLRREFEYSIVAAPPAGESTEAMEMAQMADGTILVVSAQHTRRVAAGKVKDALESAQARLLGVVLSDRVFPIPEGIYRRL